MNQSEAKKRIEELKHQINKFDHYYYDKSLPLITDYEYDTLYNELNSIEKEFPCLLTKDSPTQRVLENAITGFNKIKHNPKMYSLENTYSDNELREFLNRIEKETNGTNEFIIEPKIDGVAVSIIYENGVLKKAISRGNGITGDDITNNIKTIKEIPLVLNGELAGELIVRGEVFFTKETFVKLAEEYGFSNARNAASGTLKLLNSHEAAKRHLSIRIHTVITGLAETDNEILSKLKGMKLPVIEMTKIVESAESVIETKNLWKEKRFKLPYETDGIVIKINKLSMRKKIGYTNKSPKWAFAFKYKPENAITRINSVDFQIGRTGVITPVANLEQVHLSGTIVKRATIHNFDEILRLDVQINDFVEVEKSGEIIPKIIKVIKEKRKGNNTIKIEKPKNCPSCKSELIHYNNEVALRCINVNCPARIEGNISHFVSKAGMNIENVGPALIKQLLNENIISSMSDLYKLDIETILPIERMAEKSAENVIQSIKNSQDVPLHRFIYALGIRNVGEYLANILADTYKSIDNLMNARYDKMIKINGIGDEVAQSVIIFFENERNRDEIGNLLKNGVNPKLQIKRNILKEQKFVITGRLEQFTRDSIKRSIIENGGIVLNAISMETDFLIAGENSGSKIKKAEKLDVKIIDEKKYLQMLEK